MARLFFDRLPSLADTWERRRKEDEERRRRQEERQRRLDEENWAWRILKAQPHLSSQTIGLILFSRKEWSLSRYLR